LYKLSPARYPIVQEFVHGEGWGVSGVWNNGRALALVTHRRLREKTATGGTSTLREVLPNRILEQYTIKLMRHVKWHGAAMVEYKYDPETRQAWFVEVNPRLWGSLALPVAAGLDIPWILYNLALGNPVNGATPKSGIKSRWLLGDLIAAAGLAGSGEIKAALKALMPIKGAVYDDWFLDDPMVLAGEAGYYGWKFIKSGLSTNPVEQGMLG
jgi:predicted ATP-grasp superfamily ATP-dependent carboligase